jgi:SAM-dependent methyltransferase
MSEATAPYGAGFFTVNAESSRPSARLVLGALRELYSPASIVDIGCGSGAWLATAGELGFTVLKGYDGPWADPARYTSSAIDFTPVNLEEVDLEITERYDLAMSVEVAEHLSEARADVIVDALCSASDVVLFGAAVPQQGGVHHVNEQPQSYWIAKFKARGYEPYDVIRPRIWDDPAVKFWFKQNTMLFVKSSSEVLDRQRLHALETPIYDLIHPEQFQRKIERLTAAWLVPRNQLRRRIDRLEARNQKLRERNRELRARLVEVRGTSRARRQRIRTLRNQVSRLERELRAQRRSSTRRIARGLVRRIRRG